MKHSKIESARHPRRAVSTARKESSAEHNKHHNRIKIPAISRKPFLRNLGFFVKAKQASQKFNQEHIRVIKLNQRKRIVSTPHSSVAFVDCFHRALNGLAGTFPGLLEIGAWSARAFQANGKFVGQATHDYEIS